MATAGTITVTGKVGPEVTLTAKAFEDVKELKFDLVRQVLEITCGSPTRIIHIDLYTIATVTYTIATRVATVAVSTQVKAMPAKSSAQYRFMQMIAHGGKKKVKGASPSKEVAMEMIHKTSPSDRKKFSRKK